MPESEESSFRVVTSRADSKPELSTTCWFCETRPAEPGAIAKVNMRKYIGTKGGVVTIARSYYNARTVVVPRCGDCKKRHGIEVWLTPGYLLSIIGAGLLSIIFVNGFLYKRNDKVAAWPGVTVGIIVAVALAAVGVRGYLKLRRLCSSQSNLKPSSSRARFPEALALKEDGFEIIEDADFKYR